MKISVLSVGKMRDRRVRDLSREYRKRLGHHMSVQDVEVSKVKKGNAQAVMEGEAQALTSATPDGAYTIAMTEEGKLMKSLEVASTVQQWMVEGRQDVVFYIGGAHGLAPELKRRAVLRWSLSKMTFPHDMARMLLWEQLYRAMTIIRGEPYHK